MIGNSSETDLVLKETFLSTMDKYVYLPPSPPFLVGVMYHSPSN